MFINLFGNTNWSISLKTEYVEQRLKELTCHLRHVNSFLRYDNDRYVSYYTDLLENMKHYNNSRRLHNAKISLHKLIRYMISNSSFMVSYKKILLEKYNNIRSDYIRSNGYDDFPCFEVFYFSELKIKYSEYKTLFMFTGKTWKN